MASSSLADCSDEDISNLASSIARRIQMFSVLTSADANIILTIFSHSDLKTAFLSSFNHRAFFIGIVMYLLQNEVNNISLDCYKCEFDHNFIVDLISRCFNCMTKNLVRDFTNSHHKEANARKLNKLSGKCSK